MSIEVVFLIIALILSVVLHEVSHGYVANMLGDPTARLQGRLTLNPIVHLDMVGSILLPALLVFSGSPFLFGWAKPVPYNPYNLQKGGRWAESLVAGAGPAVNFALALIFAALFQIFGGLASGVEQFVFYIVSINIMLGVFNLIPIPPLDGSKVLSAILPVSLAMQYERFRSALEMNPFLGLGAVFLFIIFFGSAFAQVILSLTQILIG